MNQIMIYIFELIPRKGAQDKNSHAPSKGTYNIKTHCNGRVILSMVPLLYLRCALQTVQRFIIPSDPHLNNCHVVVDRPQEPSFLSFPGLIITASGMEAP